jgi:phytoene synthase
LLGAPPALLPALQEAGAAYGLAGVLRSVAVLQAQGRCLLPLDALAAEGLGPDAVVAAPEAAAVRAVVAGLARPALRSLPALGRRLRALPRVALPAALPLVLARRDLRRLAAGRAVPVERGFGDRAAVTLAGLLGRA